MIFFFIINSSFQKHNFPYKKKKKIHTFFEAVIYELLLFKA